MPKITFVQVIYNNKPFIERVFGAIYKQTIKDFNVVAVISGNEDGGKELLMEKFPQVEIIDPGFNIGFAKGHNLVFEKYESDYFQLVNPDLIMEPEYTEKLLAAMEKDPHIGAATGKLLKYDFIKNVSTSIIDSTGVTISKSGRARDRGQYETDRGQYDQKIEVQAVSAAGAMYRREALEQVKSRKEKVESNSNLNPIPSTLNLDFEYFDEDFHSYWEDVDLAWRMVNAGWTCEYVPQAVAYHGRGAGSSKNGYADVPGFIKHHKKISPWVKRLNYQNHIFMYIKNSRWFWPQFFVREFFMLGYILVFETATLKVIPEMWKLLPKIWEKRKIILQNKKTVETVS